MSESTTEKLFRALVMGGAMLSLSACSTTSSNQPETQTPAPQTQPTKAPDPQALPTNCDEICDGPKGRERVCPDPMIGADNCCWLMGELHPCCDEE